MKKMIKKYRKAKGFTLVELLIVITRLLHHTRVKTIRAVATSDIFLLSEQKALLCYFIPLRNLLKTSCFG